jgi:putative PIN family toxin of toxin-antitoxin system
VKVVLDPGVLVSALIAPKGAPGQLLDLLLEDRFDVIVSHRLLDELAGVLLRAKFRRYVSPSEVHQLVAEMSAVAIMADDPPDPPPVTRDPGDDFWSRWPSPPGPTCWCLVTATWPI